MHMNHFPTHLQEPLPWFHKPANQYSVDFEDRLSVNETSQHHHHTAEAAAAAAAQIPMYDKEPMFEKPLTPSDVGKLNRLVIPKQHAERYFPLGAGDAAGTLLGFEDEAGKSWRFRYSYWNSSQSYVLTKGWSRYVKDKRLDAGDVVFFERHRSDREKLFIGWRRRGAPTSTAVCYNAQGYHVPQDSRRQIPPLNYQPDCPPCHQGGGPGKEEQEVTRVHSPSNNNNPTRLVRLFGVNFECQQDDSSSRTTSSEGSSSSIQQQQQQQQAYHNYFNYMGYPGAPSYHNHHQHQMDMEFEQGMKQMGNRLG